jgi:hypothetical protein
MSRQTTELDTDLQELREVLTRDTCNGSATRGFAERLRHASANFFGRVKAFFRSEHGACVDSTRPQDTQL